MRHLPIRLISCLLLLSLLTGATLPYVPAALRQAEAAGTAIDPSASTWAVAELELALSYGLTYPAIMSSFVQDITREEFCVIVVKLYEKLSGQAVQAGANPFGDTSNPEVIKAAQLGIVNGTAPGVFSPAAKITRQQICAMIFRALQGALPGLDETTTGTFPFTDIRLIAPYAWGPMRFCYENQIIKGVSATLINPLGNTSREQGIVLVKRTYERYLSVAIVTPPDEPDPDEPQPPDDDGMVVLSPPAAQLPEVTKFLQQDFDNLLGKPNYRTKLTLYVASDAVKPAAKPTAGGDYIAAVASAGPAADAVDGLLEDASAAVIIRPPIIAPPTLPIVWDMPRPAGSVYSSASFAALVDSGGNKQRWFAFNLKTSSAANVVWQVSKAQFNGFATGWRTPAGLVSSGQVPASASEFMIDFGTFAPSAEAGYAIAAIGPGSLANADRRHTRTS